ESIVLLSCRSNDNSFMHDNEGERMGPRNASWSGNKGTMGNPAPTRNTGTAY
ncbi:hypothetical protein BaRGS_00006791, partial [Batillaria attramentaria]